MFLNQRSPPRRKHLRNGDIICIVTTWPSGYTSHVGARLPGQERRPALHACLEERARGDRRLASEQLSEPPRTDAGTMVARPNDVSSLSDLQHV